MGINFPWHQQVMGCGARSLVTENSQLVVVGIELGTRLPPHVNHKATASHKITVVVSLSVYDYEVKYDQVLFTTKEI